MNFIEKIKIKFFATKVGEDDFFNQYYIDKYGNKYVIYRGQNEVSKIPPKWHLWIHDINKDVLDSYQQSSMKYSWQKIHLPNLTGTKSAFSLNGDNKRKKKYHSWNNDFNSNI